MGNAVCSRNGCGRNVRRCMPGLAMLFLLVAGYLSTAVSPLAIDTLLVVY